MLKNSLDTRSIGEMIWLVEMGSSCLDATLSDCCNRLKINGVQQRAGHIAAR
jgi:hypothetical protein